MNWVEINLILLEIPDKYLSFAKENLSVNLSIFHSVCVGYWMLLKCHIRLSADAQLH